MTSLSRLYESRSVGLTYNVRITMILRGFESQPSSSGNLRLPTLTIYLSSNQGRATTAPVSSSELMTQLVYSQRQKEKKNEERLEDRWQCRVYQARETCSMLEIISHQTNFFP